MKKTLTLSFLMGFTMMATSCASSALDKSYDVAVEQMNDEHDAAIVREDAPLLNEQFNDRAFKDKFIVSVCKEKAGSFSEGCVKQYVAMIDARLRETYKLANIAEVNQKCQAYPVECDGGASDEFERWVRKSHNENVERSRAGWAANLKEQLARGRGQQQAQDAYKYKAMGEALNGLSDRLRAPAAKSHRCESIPDGRGGMTTTCMGQ